MTQVDKNRLLEEIDTAIDCIELLDDRSPISTNTLREIRQEILKVEADEQE